MLTHWNKLINTDCKVYELGNHFVYPIMRNGSTSLRAVVGKKYENQQISQCTDMLIFISNLEVFQMTLNRFQESTMNHGKMEELIIIFLI